MNQIQSHAIKSRVTAPQFRQQRFAYASSHAGKRIAQRTSMNTEELMDLLDSGSCVNIGQAAGSHRRHLLFYSPKDKFCYVAIQDERYGKVITILPPAYHKNLAWRITDDQYQLAKERYESYVKAVDVKDEAEKTNTPRDIIVWVQVVYISEELLVKRKTLFRMPINYHGDDFEGGVKEALKDPELHKKIDEIVKEKGLFQDTIYALCFRQEKNGMAFYNLALRSEYEAEFHADNRCKVRTRMNQILSRHTSPYVLLPAPGSSKLSRTGDNQTGQESGFACQHAESYESKSV